MKKSKVLILIVFLHCSYFSFSQNTDSTTQKKDSTKSLPYISSSIGITNNGISIVPSFSLEKPAVQFNLAIGKNRLSFEPDIRFSLKGKPWSMLFWGRYKLVTNNRFRMNVGTHLGLNFKTSVQPINGDTSEVTIARRYLAFEVSPNYFLSKNISVGMYYLYSHGLDAGTIGNTHFITFNTNFSNIKLTDQFFMKLNPQIYYLKLDRQDGFYFTSSLTLAKKNFPLIIQSTINKIIDTHIAGSKNILWNVSLVYSFNKNYVSRK